MNPSKKVKRLLEDGALTCAFHNRSLFYANRSAATPPHSEYLDFQKRSSLIAALLLSSASRQAYAEIRCIRIAQKLNTSYEDAFTLLSDRLKTVSDKYLEQRSGFIGSLIINADRGSGMIKSNAHHLWRNSTEIIKIVELALKKAARQKSLTRIPSDEWRSVRENGRLMMDEISFLNGRVDYFNNVRNSIYALMFALGGMGVGALFTLLSIFVSILISNTGK